MSASEDRPPKLYLYADDAKMFSSSAPDLQNGLDILHKWTDSLQLPLAPAKCEQLAMNRNAVKNQYYIDSNCITNLQCVKDLEVLISKDLKWCSHISRVKSMLLLQHVPIVY